MEKGFSATVDENGNLRLFDAKGFKAFLGVQKGKKLIISIVTDDGKASSFSRNYFRFKIVPEFVEILAKAHGERLSAERVERVLLSWCSVCRKGEDVGELESLSQLQVNELIKNSKYIASREFDTHIDD